MIAYLKGPVVKKLDKQIIVSIQGLGYLVNVGNDCLSKAKDGQEVELFIHTRVKEDDISLFGFFEESKLKFFKLLIGVSGIGVKTAMVILDMPIDLTRRALVEEDIAFLTKVPGLGKKTASRLVLELKSKVELDIQISASPDNIPRSLQEEAMAALESLGYDKPSIIRFLNSSSETFESSEELVRSFLQNA